MVLYTVNLRAKGLDDARPLPFVGLEIDSMINKAVAERA